MELIGPKNIFFDVLSLLHEAGTLHIEDLTKKINAGELPLEQMEVVENQLAEQERMEELLIRLRSIIEKPGESFEPDSAPGINGRYILTAGIFDAIEEIQRRGVRVKGEVNLTDAMVLLAEREPFYALTHERPFYDSGAPAGLLAGAVATAIHDPQQGGTIRAQLRTILDL